MITAVHFDVHGSTANALQEKALDALQAFSTVPLTEWTITIDAYEEGASHSGEIKMWRGEVEAKRHDAPR